MSGFSVPSRIEEITPEWMTCALTPRFPGIQVTALNQTLFIDGTAQKCRFALKYDRGTVGPSSLWVKGGFDPKGAQQGDAFANEVRFFKDIAPELPVNVPDCFYGEIDPSTNNGVVVLEDLILRDASFGRATKPLTPDQAADVLAMQAACHARYWKSDETSEFRWLKPGGAIAEAGVVDQYFQLWEASRSFPRFRYLTAEQRDRSRTQTALNNLMRDLKNNPTCLLHGDSQGGNLFFEKDGRPGYLDWQHCMLGHWAFDVCGFIMTSLDVEDRRKNERDFIRYYISELAAGGASAPSFESAWFDYSKYAMWAFMWVMCPVEAHPEEVCSANTERACAAIADLRTLEKLGA